MILYPKEGKLEGPLLQISKIVSYYLRQLIPHKTRPALTFEPKRSRGSSPKKIPSLQI
jgi:hypothetical protein